jgi:hypothetical protein
MIHWPIQPVANLQPDFLGPLLTIKTVADFPAYLPRSGSETVCGQRIVFSACVVVVVVPVDGAVRGAVLAFEREALE